MFFYTQFMISALLAASSVFGVPSVKCQDSNPCDGLGTGAYSNLIKFRIAVFKPISSDDHGTALNCTWALRVLSVEPHPERS